MKELWAFLVSFFNNYVIDTVKEMRIVDVVDIFVLSLVLYLLYKFIRDRRAGKLAIGLIAIFALLFFSSIFNMHALGVFFDNFYQGGLIAILIVFQPELRAALGLWGGVR